MSKMEKTRELQSERERKRTEMDTREEAAEHPLRRKEDCGASLKAIVSSQEVQSNRARGEGGREKKRERGEEREKENHKGERRGEAERERENENDKRERREGVSIGILYIV